LPVVLFVRSPSDQDVAALDHLLSITSAAVRSLFANPEEVARLQLTQTMKARVAYRIKNLRFAKARVRPT